MEANGRLADALDDLEYRGALLLAHGIAKDAPEQANVVAERNVLFIFLNLRRLGTRLVRLDGDI